MKKRGEKWEARREVKKEFAFKQIPTRFSPPTSHFSLPNKEVF